VDPSLAAYVTLTALLVATPGASTAVVVRNALQGGRAAGFAAASGIALANTSWAVAAGFGVTALFTRVPAIFSTIRYAGAGYLAWLGVRALWRALTQPRRADRDDPTARTGDVPTTAAFREGVAVNLLNPPIITFYVVVVPSFLRAPTSPGRFALFAAIHVGLAFVCHAVWVLGFDLLRSAWSRPAARRTIDAVTGAALVVLAWRMLR
jgi:threonine/homoserine/homoserine lactone efflux protein